MLASSSAGGFIELVCQRLQNGVFSNLYPLAVKGQRSRGGGTLAPLTGGRFKLKRKYALCDKSLPYFKRPEVYWTYRNGEHLKVGVTLGLSKKIVYKRFFDLSYTASGNPEWLRELLSICEPLSEQQERQFLFESTFRQLADTAAGRNF